MNTFDAAGVILIVFAGFELMRWFDSRRLDGRHKGHVLEASQHSESYPHGDQWRDDPKNTEVGTTQNILDTLWED